MNFLYALVKHADLLFVFWGSFWGLIGHMCLWCVACPSIHPSIHPFIIHGSVPCGLGGHDVEAPAAGLGERGVRDTEAFPLWVCFFGGMSVYIHVCVLNVYVHATTPTKQKEIPLPHVLTSIQTQTHVRRLQRVRVQVRAYHLPAITIIPRANARATATLL